MPQIWWAELRDQLREVATRERGSAVGALATVYWMRIHFAENPSAEARRIQGEIAFLFDKILESYTKLYRTLVEAGLIEETTNAVETQEGPAV